MSEAEGPNASDYGDNLRLCCSYFRSISEVCRRLGINRQQFNKYMSGQSAPSRHNHRRLSDFFGLDDHELFLPHDTFAVVLGEKRRQAPRLDMTMEVAKQLSSVLASEARSLKIYTGYYFRYFYSMTDATNIKRDLSHFYFVNDIVCTSTKEKVSPDMGDQVRSKFQTYRGFVALRGDRLFWIDCDRRLDAEISMTILYPSTIRYLTRLEGLVLGTGLDRLRRIAAGRVMLEFLGGRVDVRRCLDEVGVFDAEDPRIPDYVRRSIAIDLEPDARLLQARV